MGVAVKFVCCECGFQAYIDYITACSTGWYWERHVGNWYDYYCPACARKKGG